MVTNGYPCGNTLKELFEYFHVPKEQSAYLTGYLISEGYSKKGICYGAARKRDTLLKYVGDSRFNAVFINAVRMYATNWRNINSNEKRKSKENKGDK